MAACLCVHVCVCMHVFVRMSVSVSMLHTGGSQPDPTLKVVVLAVTGL